MATTINSITLSSDLTTLYLIDNGRAISFNLRNKNGILVGMLDGQLSVATAPPIVIAAEDDSSDNDNEPDRPVGMDDSPIKLLAKRPRKLKLPANDASWNMFFIQKKRVVSIIGALDIDISIIGALDIDISLTRTIPDEAAAVDSESVASGRCQIFSFDISKDPIIIRRNGKRLIIQY